MGTNRNRCPGLCAVCAPARNPLMQIQRSLESPSDRSRARHSGICAPRLCPQTPDSPRPWGKSPRKKGLLVYRSPLLVARPCFYPAQSAPCVPRRSRRAEKDESPSNVQTNLIPLHAQAPASAPHRPALPEPILHSQPQHSLPCLASSSAARGLSCRRTLPPRHQRHM